MALASFKVTSTKEVSHDLMTRTQVYTSTRAAAKWSAAVACNGRVLAQFNQSLASVCVVGQSNQNSIELTQLHG